MSKDIARKPEQAPESSLPGFVPATDILEMEDGFHVMADMPGVPKESLNIDVEEDEVVISGKSAYGFREGVRVMHREFVGGEFTRRLSIAGSVDRERISARLKNGVLNLSLPKSEAAKPRRIEIQTG
jgi:HSP20 family molecular chaperone IbpA